MFLKIVVLVIFVNIKIIQALVYVYGIDGEGTDIGTKKQIIPKNTNHGTLLLETPKVPPCGQLSFVKVKLLNKGEKVFHYKTYVPRVYFAFNNNFIGAIYLDFYEALNEDAEYEVTTQAIMDQCYVTEKVTDKTTVKEKTVKKTTVKETTVKGTTVKKKNVKETTVKGTTVKETSNTPYTKQYQNNRPAVSTLQIPNQLATTELTEAEDAGPFQIELLTS